MEQLGFRLGLDDGSFTALLQLPPPQAAELLVKEDSPAEPPIFSSDFALADRASNFSVFASAQNNDSYGNITDEDSTTRADTVKQEPVDSDSNHSSKSGKRKERERKVKESSKKSKKVAASESSDAAGERLPYVHVRARRGQATNSHSLAERARREKINERMKLLRELVPGCNKISGTSMVLDEIINHVQALQRQVEFLSMRLATVSPRIDFDLEGLLLSDHEPVMESSHWGMSALPVWPEQQANDAIQQHPWNHEGLHHHHHHHQQQQQQPTLCSKEGDESNFLLFKTPHL